MNTRRRRDHSRLRFALSAATSLPISHALYSAVYNGHHDIAKLLLEHGAYPSPPVESSADALSIAMSNGDERMVELLCSYGSTRSVDLLAHYGDVKTAAAVFAANPKLANDPGAFANAAGNGHEAFMRLMLRYCPDLHRRAQFPGWLVGAKTPELNAWLFWFYFFYPDCCKNLDGTIRQWHYREG